jgi:hypothetical protein
MTTDTAEFISMVWHRPFTFVAGKTTSGFGIMVVGDLFFPGVCLVTTDTAEFLTVVRIRSFCFMAYKATGRFGLVSKGYIFFP